MIYNTLISVHQLQQAIHEPDWVIIDCRFSLSDDTLGEYLYRQGHLPYARYAHLDKQLSSTIKDYTGRHPLPDWRVFVKQLGAWGIHNHSQVVVYDDAGGAFAARLWWLLRYVGCEAVAVLDGGIDAWRACYPVTTHLPTIQTQVFRAYFNSTSHFNATDVENGLARKTICLIDARAKERYLGLIEPIDKVAGHIAGALNRPFSANLHQGKFLPAAQLHAQFTHLIGTYPPDNVVHYCGSGVTACHNLLAMDYAGLTGSKLYAGAWSEWIQNKNRRICAVN